MRATGGGEGKKEEADAKFAVANDLRDQGNFEPIARIKKAV